MLKIHISLCLELSISLLAQQSGNRVYKTGYSSWSTFSSDDAEACKQGQLIGEWDQWFDSAADGQYDHSLIQHNSEPHSSLASSLF